MVAILLPREVIRYCMLSGQNLVELMNMSVKVIERAYNGLGLLYLVEGRTCDIEALLDLGFIEWA